MVKFAKFSNIETKNAYKWYGNEIDYLLIENSHLPEKDLIILLSEMIEGKIEDSLMSISEGYVSDIVKQSLSKINYSELIAISRFYNN